MNILKNIVGRVREKFFSKNPNSVDLNRYDKGVVEREVEENNKLKELIKQEEKKSPGFEHLFEDLFGSLYKKNPALSPDEKISAEAKINKKRINQLMDSDEYQDLRQKTTLDRSASIIAAINIAEEISRNDQDNNWDNSWDKREADEIKQRLESLLEDAEQAEENKLSTEKQKILAKSIEENEKKLEDINQELEESTERSKNQMEGIIKSAVEKAKQDAELLEDALMSLGFSQEQIDRMSTERKMNLLDSLTKMHSIKRMLELIGRFRKIASKMARQSTLPDNYSISGITLGSDIMEITNQEAIQALHPDLKTAFFQRWMDEELEIYEKDDKVPTGKGPIIACIDVSGSMQGEKEYWTKALMMAFMEIARKEHRNMYIIYFDDYLQNEYMLKRGKASPEKLLEILGFFTGGNTDFQKPLTRASEVIIKEGMSKADILFVTDGQARMEPDFLNKLNQQKQQMEFGIISVLVDIYDQYGSSPETLELFSDQIMPIKELTNENAQEILSALKK